MVLLHCSECPSCHRRFLPFPKADSKGAGVNIASAPHDIQPGEDKATLTFSDGRKIILNSPHSSRELHEMGMSSLEADSNNLKYAEDHQGETSRHTLSIPTGGQYSVILSDGTKVWMNSASTLSYPSSFQGNERSVTLTGEGYFEVAHNPRKPFIVQLPDDSKVEVLGTRFNINSYPDEARISTTLIEGPCASKKVRDQF